MIDSVLYEARNIPQDSLKHPLLNSYGFENQIRINDFSLAFPQKNYNNSHKQLEIKIIHKKDTMFICQSTGTGSFLKNVRDKPIKQNPDFTLQFIKGHYFFPKWAKDLLDNLPQASGFIKIVNIDQHHFIIPKTLYDSICNINRKYDNRQQYYDKAENLVVENFMKNNFSFERRTIPTTFNISVRPFSKPRWSYWENAYFPTKEKDEYIGIVQFSYDTLNYSGGRGTIVRFNEKTNEMKIWSPTEDLIYSSTALLYKDTFNNVYYNRSIIRDSSCKELIYKCDFITKFYHSSDEGITWEENKKLTQLYDQHEIRKLEFLDQDHALIFKLDKIRHKNKKYDIQQGTYYLLKDFHIIDSLKTPNDVHYNDNYSGYRYEVINDTIFLGSWTYEKNYTFGKTKYYQPTIKKIANKWKFEVVEKTYSRTQSVPKKDIISTYENFKILNNILYLNSENGSLVFNTANLSELNKRGLILENGKEIYIIGIDIGTLLSFDSGYTWYVYPLPLEKDSRYEFIEIDKQSVISHLKNSWGKDGYEFNKVFSQFIKIEE